MLKPIVFTYIRGSSGRDTVEKKGNKSEVREGREHIQGGVWSAGHTFTAHAAYGSLS